MLSELALLAAKLIIQPAFEEEFDCRARGMQRVVPTLQLVAGLAALGRGKQALLLAEANRPWGHPPKAGPGHRSARTVHFASLHHSLQPLNRVTHGQGQAMNKYSCGSK
jgi:hypothetical protein